MRSTRSLATLAAQRVKPKGPRPRALSAAASNVEVVGEGRSNPHALLVTCEHAGNALPADVAWSTVDIARGLPTQHWAYDPGARDCKCGLRGRKGARVS